MHRDYIGLREKEEKGPCQALRLLMKLALAYHACSAETAGVSSPKFHSQVAHRADLVTAGMCGLCPPAPSRQPHSTLAPSGWPKRLRPGMEAAGKGRAALCILWEFLSCLKSSAFQRRADPYIEMWHCYESNKSLIGELGKNGQWRGQLKFFSKGLTSYVLRMSLFHSPFDSQDEVCSSKKVPGAVPGRLQ